MRKTLILISLIWLFSCLAFPAAIQVVNPKGGETVSNTTDYTIRWNTSLKPTVKVKILLYNKNGKTKIAAIANPTSNSGQFLWKKHQINSIKDGTYTIIIRTLNNLNPGISAPFEIKKEGGAQIGIIEVTALKPASNPNIRGHRAPALTQPSNASFKIKNINYGVDKSGQLNAVWVEVGYSSKTPFAFSKYKGHPTDGPAYMNCKITIPYWPDIPGYKGPFKTKDIFNQRLSVKYNGQNNLKCVPEILNAGSGEFELIFGPAHSGKVEALYTKQKLPKTNFFEGHDTYCQKTYWPKMALRLFVHTKEGVKQAYKEFYLDRGAGVKSATIPGTINLCTKGFQRW